MNSIMEVKLQLLPFLVGLISLTTQALMNEALISLTTTTNFKSIMISYIATGFFKDFSVYLIESIVF